MKELNEINQLLIERKKVYEDSRNSRDRRRYEERFEMLEQQLARQDRDSFHDDGFEAEARLLRQ
jgi:hypothetical protein